MKPLTPTDLITKSITSPDKLFLSEKIKLTLINSVPYDDMLEACHGQPVYFDSVVDITNAVIAKYPEIVTDKLVKDSKKIKPRFNGDVYAVIRQVMGEVGAMFVTQPDCFRVNDELLSTSTAIYCYAPLGAPIYITNYIEDFDDNFIDDSTLMDASYFQLINPSKNIITEPVIADIPTEMISNGYVYTLSHKIEN